MSLLGPHSLTGYPLRFQWAYLVIDQLLELKIDSDVRQYIERLPDGLKVVYDDIWDRIMGKMGSARDIALRAFRWLMCSPIPIKADELIIAVQQDIGKNGIRAIDSCIDIELVLETCHNLIVQTDDGECRFSHLSVREYLEEHRFSASEAGTFVGSICLQYLTDPIILQDHPSPDSFNILIPVSSIPIENHVNAWFIHAREWDPEGSAPHERLLCHFLGGPRESSPFYQDWVERMCLRWDLIYALSDLPDEHDKCVPSSCTSLGIIYWDLRGAWRSWKDSIDITATNIYGEGLVHIAVKNGYLEMCQELLHHGLNPDTLDKKGISPLVKVISSAGKERSRYKLANLLLETGNANPNLGRLKDLSSPLLIACRQMDSDIVELLLRHGADQSLICHSEWGIAVNYIAGNETSSADTLKRLLELGLDPTLPTQRFGNALHAAAFSGSLEKASVLLEREDISINSVGGEYGTALNAAILRGKYGYALTFGDCRKWLRFREFLIEQGADITLAAGKYGTPMQCAARKGRPHVIEDLLRLGADPNCVDDQHPFSPLYLTCKHLFRYISRYRSHGNSLQLIISKRRTWNWIKTIEVLDRAGAEIIPSKTVNSYEEDNFAKIEEVYSIFRRTSDPSQFYPETSEFRWLKTCMDQIQLEEGNDVRESSGGESDGREEVVTSMPGEPMGFW